MPHSRPTVRLPWPVSSSSSSSLKALLTPSLSPAEIALAHSASDCVHLLCAGDFAGSRDAVMSKAIFQPPRGECVPLASRHVVIELRSVGVRGVLGGNKGRLCERPGGQADLNQERATGRGGAWKSGRQE